MKEKNLDIGTPDGKVIKAILRGSLRRPVIVHVHGLGGDMHEAMHYNAARYFETAGFTSLRFNLYSWEREARKLHEASFATHGQDIDTVLEYLVSKGAKQIFILGHSYGFPSILHTKRREYSAIAAWDGSQLPVHHVATPMKVNKPKGRLVDFGWYILVSEKMAKDSETLDSIALLKKFDKPISFITVDDNIDGNLDGNKLMHDSYQGKKELVIIKGAHHNFAEEGAQEKLYKATVKWFKKFC